MKNYIVYMIVFLGVVKVLAADWDFAVAELLPGENKRSYVGEITSPGAEATESSIIHYDENGYLPFGFCTDIVNADGTNFKEGVFHVTSLAESLEKAVEKGTILDTWHWMLLYTLDYTVTCSNHITYRGVFVWRTELSNCKLNCSDDERTQYFVDVDTYNYSTNTFKAYRNRANEDKKNVVPISNLIAAWKGRKVAYPEWRYISGPSRLSRPVIFVHGLNDDYKTWGVKTVVEKGKDGINKGDESFQKGLVEGYDKGSAPDILARFLNINNSKDSINHNGIYFFQAPGNVENGKWKDAKPHWNGTNGGNSQSSKLYRRLIEVLDDFYKDSNLQWREHPELIVDIVAHSQGGLVVREMLRGLRAENASAGPENPANHIGRLVTVDTPHLGAATASKDSKDIPSHPGLGILIDDLNAYYSGNAVRHSLMNLKIGVDYLNPLIPVLFGKASGAVGGSLGVLGMAFSVIAGDPIVGPIATTAGGTAIFVGGMGAATAGAAVATAAPIVSTVALAEYNVYVSGPYLGPYKISFNIDPPGPGVFNIPWSIELDAAAEYRDMAIENRTLGDYLYKENDFMRKLNDGKNGESYPRLPNGKRLNILPLYSGDVSMVVVQLLKGFDEKLRIKCPEFDSDEDKMACAALDSYLQKKVNQLSEAYTKGTVNADIDINDSLLTVLDNVRETWLTNSDLIVETESQKYESKELGISDADIAELGTARPYLFHDALAPWETVIHMGGIPGTVASTRQGLDIACALDCGCDNLLAEKPDAKVIYLKDGCVDLTGDFNIVPVFLNEGKHGIRVSYVQNTLDAVYEPGVGSYVDYMVADGGTWRDVVVSADIATVPRLQRNGQNILALFENYSGKTFSKEYSIPEMAANVSICILGEGGESLPAVIAGEGTVTDQDSQLPPSPPDVQKTEGSIFVMHREARGENEVNTSRPRILVANTSDRDILGFKVAYYFTADPARLPQVVVDYPKIPVTLENLGGDQWRFVLDASDSVLNAMSAFPSLDGWQIRLYYERDWSDFDYLDDWSADYNIGVPRMNKRIVVYDVNGRILWGQEPEPFRSSDNGLIPAPKGIISWSDVAPWENNMFKPQVTVKNTGSVALKDYHAKLWFRVPEGRELYIPEGDWYTPYSRPMLRNSGENVWELDLFFNEYVLYPGDSVIEGNIGVHLKDWSVFDKTVCGIALIDSDGNVVYGKIPSVSECQSYDAPSLLEAQYVWRF